MFTAQSLVDVFVGGDGPLEVDVGGGLDGRVEGDWIAAG